MVMLVVENVPNVCLDIYKPRCQIIVIPVVNFLYQDYTHTACKHNFIYNSVYIKMVHGSFNNCCTFPLSLSAGGKL